GEKTSSRTKSYRIVPMSPRLHDILLDAYSEAAEGQRSVCGLSENNLTRNGVKHVKAAGLKPWKKLYQSLRSSCENDWKIAGIAGDTYAKWMGHSLEVSSENYAAP